MESPENLVGHECLACLKKTVNQMAGAEELALRAGILQCRGVVLCVNDRVGLPRPLNVPGQDSFLGVVADGTSDSLAGALGALFDSMANLW